MKVDQYKCPECGYQWGGYGRSPPKAFCPECGDAMLRQLSAAEDYLQSAGFIPVRFA